MRSFTGGVTHTLTHVAPWPVNRYLPGTTWAVTWGLHMGLTQGLLATLVADTAPEKLRGTAFGIFNLALGVVMLIASVIAGALWQGLGAKFTFLAGAAFTTIALLGLAVIRYREAAAT